MSKGMVNRVDARLFQTAHFYICENVLEFKQMCKEYTF